jgi:hypothetical protein
VKTVAHKIVGDLAVKMAQTVYEERAKDNTFYAQFPNRNAFVRQFAPMFISDARAVLTDMLQQESISDAEREDIFNALILDRTLPRGPGRAIQ